MKLNNNDLQSFEELPQGWAITTLGEILPLTYGKALKKETRDESGNVPVYGSSGQVGVHSSALTQKPALIVGRKGSVGEVYRSPVPCWPIDTVYFAEERDDGDLKYFEYLLNGLSLSKLDKSTAVPGLSRDDYNAVEVAIAPLDQQKRIVAEIEKQFSRLDEAVANLKHVKANLKRYKAAVLKAAVEGRLVQTEAERARREGRSFETGAKLLQRSLEERRQKWEEAELAKMKEKDKARKDDKWKNKYKEPTAPGTNDLGEPPEGWVWATIGQAAECLDSMRIPVNKKERLKRNGDIPYYGANGQVDVIDDFIFDEPLVLVVEDETFTGREIPFSYKITGKSWVNNHAHVLRATGMVSVDFLNYALSFYPFTPLTTGTTGRKKLTQLALVSAPLRIPPLHEQHRIVLEIDRRLSLLRETEAQAYANLQRAKRLRQSILGAAFAGRIGAFPIVQGHVAA